MASTAGSFSRRDLLRTGVAASGFVLAANALVAPAALAQAPANVRIRRNIYTATSAEKEALVKGVAEMKKRLETEKTSWLYQANMHGTVQSPVQPLWNTCQHGTFFFLSWHRMYVYHFERILRAASGDTSFNLPYWDYENDQQRVMPEMFRLPASDTNPLYVKQRSDVNDGVPLKASVVSASEALGTPNFDATDNNPSFGGRIVKQPAHMSSGAGRLERQPHNVVHTAIGGQGGWMSAVTTAARDPIFWLHHCNIDRLWAKWNAQGGNDPSSGIWSTQIFEFYDENGNLVQMKGEEVVDTARQLGYEYDDVAVVAQSDETPHTASRSRMPQQESAPKVLAMSAAKDRSSLSLGSNDATFTLQPEASTERAMAAASSEPTTLLFENIAYKQPVGVYYEVYLNKPADAPFDADGPYFAGNLSFFGVGHSHSNDGAVEGASTTVDIGNVLVEQKKKGLWSGKDIHVDLHPQSGGTTKPGTKETYVSIGQVKLLDR